MRNILIAIAVFFCFSAKSQDIIGFQGFVNSPLVQSGDTLKLTVNVIDFSSQATGLDLNNWTDTIAVWQGCERYPVVMKENAFGSQIDLWILASPSQFSPGYSVVIGENLKGIGGYVAGIDDSKNQCMLNYYIDNLSNLIEGVSGVDSVTTTGDTISIHSGGDVFKVADNKLVDGVVFPDFGFPAQYSIKFKDRDDLIYDTPSVNLGSFELSYDDSSNQWNFSRFNSTSVFNWDDRKTQSSVINDTLTIIQPLSGRSSDGFTGLDTITFVGGGDTDTALIRSIVGDSVLWSTNVDGDAYINEAVGIFNSDPFYPLQVGKNPALSAGSSIAVIGDGVNGMVIKESTASNPYSAAFFGPVKFWNGSEGGGALINANDDAGTAGQVLTSQGEASTFTWETIDTNTVVGLGAFVDNNAPSQLWTESSANVYRSSGNVGIGTSAPSAKLDVVGDAEINGSVTITDIISMNDNVAIGNDPLNSVTGAGNTGIGYRSGNGIISGNFNVALGYQSLRYAANPSQALGIGINAMKDCIACSKTVAIGSSAGEDANSDQSIFIGYFAGRTASRDNVLYIENSGSATPLIYGEFDNDLIRINGEVEISDYTGGTPTGLLAKDATGQIVDADASLIASTQLWTESGANVYRSSGNVGIGTATPGHDLDVQGAIGFGATATATQPYLDHAGGGNAELVLPGTSGFNIENTANASFRLLPSFNDIYFQNNLSTGGMRFTGAFGATYSGNTIFNTTGNVGIGNSNPQTDLHVTGDIRAETTSNPQIQTRYTGGPYLKQQSLINYGYIGTENSYPLSLITNNSQRLTIDTDGDVGIGTATPSVELDVVGRLNLDDGNINTFIDAGNATLTGNSNVGIGNRALESMTTGFQNVAIGRLALSKNTTGFQNFSLGRSSLLNNISGYQNVALGTETLLNNNDNRNTAIGHRSGYSATGGNNSYIGYFSGYSGTGDYTVAIGDEAGRNAGSRNVAIGRQAGFNAGSDNVMIGYQSGLNETGQDKLYIENSSTATPLIYGEFDNDLVRINGDLTITDSLNVIGSVKVGSSLYDVNNSKGSDGQIALNAEIPGSSDGFVWTDQDQALVSTHYATLYDARDTLSNVGAIYRPIRFKDVVTIEHGNSFTVDVANDEIDIDKTGWYEVEYNISFTSDTDAEFSVAVLDGSGSVVCGLQQDYVYSALSFGTMSSSNIANLLDTDVLSLEIKVPSGLVDIDDINATLKIRRIR
jgi:hypothetical protein